MRKLFIFLFLCFTIFNNVNNIYAQVDDISEVATKVNKRMNRKLFNIGFYDHLLRNFDADDYRNFLEILEKDNRRIITDLTGTNRSKYRPLISQETCSPCSGYRDLELNLLRPGGNLSGKVPGFLSRNVKKLSGGAAPFLTAIAISSLGRAALGNETVDIYDSLMDPNSYGGGLMQANVDGINKYNAGIATRENYILQDIILNGRFSGPNPDGRLDAINQSHQALIAFGDDCVPSDTPEDVRYLLIGYNHGSYPKMPFRLKKYFEWQHFHSKNSKWEYWYNKNH